MVPIIFSIVITRIYCNYVYCHIRNDNRNYVYCNMRSEVFDSILTFVGYLATADKTVCRRLQVGDACITNEDCSAWISNSECVDGLCACLDGFRSYSKTSCVVRKYTSNLKLLDCLGGCFGSLFLLLLTLPMYVSW